MKKKRVKHALRGHKGSPEFEAFWKRYQGLSASCQSQSKGQGVELWMQIVPDEVSADDLMRAIDGAIKDIHQRQDVGEFATPLPDCFRWLRDGYYCTT